MIRPEDIRIHAEREKYDPDNPYRYRGSIVRITHIHTGITVEKKGQSQPKLKVEALVELQRRINDMSKNKVGVFLARFQPLHNGHMYMIEKALEECERVIIVLGSANKEGLERNPFSLEIRERWLKSSLINSEDYSRITIIELPDWSTESDHEQLKQWGHYLYYNIVSRIQTKRFSIYYSDNVEIIKSWFDEEIKDFITIRSVDRSNVFDGLSATKIRKAIRDYDVTYLQKFCPPNVAKDMEGMFIQLNKVADNKKQDFSME